MAIRSRKLSHVPSLEALEDRFLPSVSSVLPFRISNHIAQTYGDGAQIRPIEKSNSDKIGSDVLPGMPGQMDASHLADAAFDSSQGDLAQMMTYRPIAAIITYDPMAMEFHETIWFIMTPVRTMVSSVKPRASTANGPLADSDDMSSMLHIVIPPNIVNSLAPARPKSEVDIPGKDLVETITPVSTNRLMDTAVAVNQSVAGLTINGTNIVLPKFFPMVTGSPEGQGSGLRLDAQPNESQEAVPNARPDLSRGTVATPDNESKVPGGARLTETQGLNTDESSIIPNEIEQAIQTLVEPFAVSLQSYEPSMLWVFLSTWIAAAGISYEYLRRKMQLNQIALDTWKEWRSLPLRHHS